MTETEFCAGDPLRVTDLVPLRRLLGSDSVVVRVTGDGAIASCDHLPMLFLEDALRHSLFSEARSRFDAACRRAAESHATQTFEATAGGDAVVIAPVLDDAGNGCQFLLCWVRHRAGVSDSIRGTRQSWVDLSPDAVAVRYRTLSDAAGTVVEAAPWWLPDGHDPIDLWAQHAELATTGFAETVMHALIIDAFASIAGLTVDVSMLIRIPSGELMAGIVPVLHGALRGSGVDPARVTLAVPVAVATEADLLPVLVHLRTMGLHIDIVGLDAFTETLYMVSDTSSLRPRPMQRPLPVPGLWADTPARALGVAA